MGADDVWLGADVVSQPGHKSTTIINAHTDTAALPQARLYWLHASGGIPMKTQERSVPVSNNLVHEPGTEEELGRLVQQLPNMTPHFLPPALGCAANNALVAGLLRNFAETHTAGIAARLTTIHTSCTACGDTPRALYQPATCAPTSAVEVASAIRCHCGVAG